MRAKVVARTRHPVAWLRSAVTRRRGLGDVDVPTGADEVLDRLGELPVSTWTYGFDHRSVRHLGPMAQDFATAFGLGSSNRRIDPIDALGVCMASIQALQRRVVALEAEVDLTNG
ncbi:tail fiber domain-containing protein [Rhodococcus sp. NPDC003318]|uniref:tail fiber domain-containing protein n=1 Tax=Rhodococcus sp. NPDC003318 TaxID=3364503 RepID=UPI0036746C82